MLKQSFCPICDRGFMGKGGAELCWRCLEVQTKNQRRQEIITFWQGLAGLVARLEPTRPKPKPKPKTRKRKR